MYTQLIRAHVHTLRRNTYTHPATEGDARARRSRSRDSGRAGRQRWVHLLQVRRYMHVVGIRALDWRRPASREGRDASQERTLILNRGRSCSERQFNERVFRGRITVVHPSGARPRETNRLWAIGRVASRSRAGSRAISHDDKKKRGGSLPRDLAAAVFTDTFGDSSGTPGIPGHRSHPYHCDVIVVIIIGTLD